MKGINTMDNVRDLGQDGYSGINSIFGKDLAAFSLEYFNSDYQAINSTTPLAGVNTTSHPASNSSQLFNGNIRYMQTRLTNLNTRASMPMLNAYKYDQLNRLKESRSYENGLSGSAWNPTTYGNEYFNSFIYDAMGNIENQIRHSRNGTLIDNLTYHYQKNSGKLVRNRLYHLNDAQTNSSAFTDDIDNMLTFRPQADRLNVNNNYNYDEEGRLLKDSSERISKIVWRVDDKVKEIQRNGGSVKWLRFDYDAMGNRIAKHVYNNTGTVLERSTYYILDAQGNQISTYDHEVVGETAQFNLKERNIFGSSRIGSKQDSLNVLTATISQNYTLILGNKYYEFTNHLGNVLTVFNDLKIPLDTNSNGLVDRFLVGITNSSDYSPFGVQLDGRTASNDQYRYGFNNMEKDDEVKGKGNSYDFGARMYDSRVGRWWSRDKYELKYPGIGTYSFSFNNPIIFKDKDGNDGILTIDYEKRTITLETVVHMYGANAKMNKEEVVFRANQFSKELLSNSVKARSVEGEIWEISINVCFVYDDNLDTDNLKNMQIGGINRESLDLPEGHNAYNFSIPELGKALGLASLGGNYSGGSNEEHIILHEVFHMLGYDERYGTDGFNAPIEYLTDVMSNFYRKDAVYVGKFHFVSLLDWTLDNFKTSGCNIVYSEKISRQNILNELEIIETGTGLQIDNTSRGTKFDENEKNSKESRIIIENE